MAFSWSSWSYTRFVVILLLLLSGSRYSNGCYTSIISFGDSLTDTGNFKQLLSKKNISVSVARPPYGETFFHQPTGRASNGRLIIDFLAESLGLPLVPPFLQEVSDNMVALGQGVNYATGDATTLDSSFLKSFINVSLGDELAWFKQSWPSLFNNVSDSRKSIRSSLIIMAEAGASDYQYLLYDGKPIGEVESYIPLVIDTIISAVNELIYMGAQTLVVQGTIPIGCSASCLTILGSENEEYDNTTGCLIRFNKIAEYHDKLLQTKLNHIRELHPNVIIIYADYYNAAMQIFRSPNKYGFTNGALKACCGGGGVYNYNQSVECGDPDATVCDDPDTYVDWDGKHFTEASYRIIFKSLFQGPYTTPQYNLLCPTSASQVGVRLSSSI